MTMDYIGRRNFLDHDDWSSRHDPACTGRCDVAASLVGGGLSLGGSIFGGMMAGDAQSDAMWQGIRQSNRMFNKAKRALMPYYSAGADVLPDLMRFIDPQNRNSPINALLKLTMPGANMTRTLQQTPGFQFTRDMGLKAIDNQLAARGLGGPGGALSRASADYVTGLSNNTWKDVVNALTQTYGAGVAPMQNLVSTGAGAAGSLAGAATQTGSQLGQLSMGLGNAQAAMWNSIGGGIGNFGNSLATGMMMPWNWAQNSTFNKLTGLYG